MLNYIKAELWKVSRRKLLYGFAALMLFLAHLFGWLISGGYFASLTAGVCTTMITGMLAAPVLAQLVDGAGADTLKNEISFGIGRSRLYWGKLLGGILLGLAFCGVLVGGVLLSGWLLMDHSDAAAEAEMLRLVGFCLWGAFPLWCGMFSLCHMLAMLVRSTAVWVSGYFIVFFFGQPMLLLASMAFFQGDTGSWQFALFQAAIMPYTLLMPKYLSGWLSWEYQLWCWGIGMGWMAASTAFGLLLLRRRDLR